MKMVNGDIIFLRDGKPAVVKNVDHKAGKVILDDNLSRVQKQADDGVINHLDEKQRAAYNVSLRDVSAESKQEEIQNLYELIRHYKDNKQVDAKVLHYLENELMHRMHRDGVTPADYQFDLRNIPQY